MHTEQSSPNLCAKLAALTLSLLSTIALAETPTTAPAEPTVKQIGSSARISVPLPRTAEAQASFTLSPDGKKIIIFYSNTAHLIDLDAAKSRWTLGDASQMVGACLLSPDSANIAISTTTADYLHHQLSVVAAQTGEALFKKDDPHNVLPVAFTPDGKVLICQDNMRRAFVELDSSTGDERGIVDFDHWWKLGPLPPIYQQISLYSPDGKWALHANKFTDLATGAHVPELLSREEYGQAAVFDPQGNFHVVLDHGTVLTFHAGDWKRTSRVECQELLSPTAIYRFLPGGDALLVIDRGRIGIMDTATGKFRGWSDYPAALTPMRTTLDVSADATILAIADGMKNNSILVQPLPASKDLRPAHPESPARPAVHQDPLPPIPAHQPADLQNPQWWLDRAAAELASSNDPLEKSMIPLTRALVAARKKDAAAATAALKDEEALLAPLGDRGKFILQNSREAVDAALKGRELRRRDMFSQPTSSRPAAPFPQAAALFRAGKHDEYNALRQPYIDIIKAAAGASSRASASLELFMFDLSTGNIEAAQAEAPNLPIEEAGWAMLLAHIQEELPADDLPSQRNIPKLANQYAGRGASLLLQSIIQAHIKAGKLEDLLPCIQSFPAAKDRADAYLLIIDALT